MSTATGTSRLSTGDLDVRFAPGLASSAKDVGRLFHPATDGRDEVASGLTDLRRGAQTLVVAVVATAVTAACSSGKSATPTVTPSPSVSPSPSVETAIIAAWRAEHVAYAKALLSLNPNDTDLAQTAINPALQRAVAFIGAAKLQGITVRGTQELGDPKVVSLNPAVRPTTAVVESCVHGGLILVNSKTGKPVPGLAGKATWNFEHTTLTLVEGVGWMVSNNVVKQSLQESSCTGS
jgi:ABC-type transport system substrate-binding protein